MTLISRILGFCRDVVIARFFGASFAADAFFIAFKITNLFRRLFDEGAFSQAFIPVLTENKESGGNEAVIRLTGATSGTLALVLFIVVSVGVLSAPLIISVFAPGFLQDTEKFELATLLLRFTFPYLFFISLTALAGSVLNVYGRFAVPAITPALLNLVLIGTAIIMAPHLEKPVKAHAYGVFSVSNTHLTLPTSELV